MSNQLDKTNVVNVSLSASPKGISEDNVDTVGIFTDETHADSFGTAGYKIYLNPREMAVDFGTDSDTYKMGVAAFSQTPNFLNGNGYLVVLLLEESETLVNAIIRASSLVQFFGIITTKDIEAEELTEASNYVQSINKVLFAVSNDPAYFAPEGTFDLIRQASNTHTRCLSYLSDNTTDAKRMAAAYAGRALSTNFSGSNTTQTMHLKDLLTILPDPQMTQTQLNQCQAAGVDCYVNIAGVAKVFTSGANEFFDEVYNICWFINAIEVAGFNTLATTSTKVPQTEEGMTLLKGNYRLVCQRAVRNQYIAPGAWNSPDRFGDVEAMLRNIEETGYYIYSDPVNLQAQTDREQRIAPLVQIAIKQAGALHKSNVMIYVNA
ncbi:hypothetical protein AAIR98_000906 [Elusimicrobium simillimum]|uniref:DUF3383 family protein n=1 Tax=Elusimicrobium simillimum TaxID=3143438 RepID=UPI003C6EEFD5